MLTIKYSNSFKRDFKRVQKRGYGIDKLKEVISALAYEQKLLPKFRDHELSGNYAGCRECHIEPDWLLVYEINENELILYLLRTGTHSDLF